MKGAVTFIAVQRMFTSHFNLCNAKMIMRAKDFICVSQQKAALFESVFCLSCASYTIDLNSTQQNWKYLTNIKCTISVSFSKVRAYIY